MASFSLMGFYAIVKDFYNFLFDNEKYTYLREKYTYLREKYTYLREKYTYLREKYTYLREKPELVKNMLPKASPTFMIWFDLGRTLLVKTTKLTIWLNMMHLILILAWELCTLSHQLHAPLAPLFFSCILNR